MLQFQVSHTFTVDNQLGVFYELGVPDHLGHKKGALADALIRRVPSFLTEQFCRPEILLVKDHPPELPKPPIASAPLRLRDSDMDLCVTEIREPWIP